MFDWLTNWVRRALNDVEHIILDVIWGAIHAVYSFILSVENWVSRGWNDLWSGINWLAREISSVAYDIWRALTWIINIGLPNLAHWAWAQLISLGHSIDWVYHQALGILDYLRHLIAHEIDNLVTWVITHIWTPIWNTLTSIGRWVEQKGETLWYYLTHPDRIARLIFWPFIKLLEDSAKDVAEVLGKFLAHLIIHNARLIASVIEDILHAVL